MPSPLVKSPPWIMKFRMTRWKVEPAYVRRAPRSPAQSARKFSQVRGNTSEYNSKVMRCAGRPPMATSSQARARGCDIVHRLWSYHTYLR